MKVKEIFDLATKIGIENDFRTKDEIRDLLKRRKEKFKKMTKEEKDFFDKDALVNPYSDSAIHHDNGKSIKKVFASIDITIGGLILAKELGADLVINHHPIGKSLSRLDDVMNLQIDMYEKYGIPVNIAEKLTKKRISEVARGVNPANHFNIVDAAKLIDINLINVHTPADNCVAKLIVNTVEKIKPRYVEDITKAIEKIPEYKEAKKKAFGPMIFSGSPENRCGKVIISEITGGTEGAKNIYQTLSNFGFGTVLAMHQSEAHRESAEKAHMNVIIAGHISSDSVGMNIFLDKLEKKGLKILPFGGLIRHSRNK